MTLDMIIAALTLAAVLFFCIKEVIPPHLAAFAGFAFLVAAGIINQDQMLSVFSNSAPFTIACMFVIAGAIESSGIMRGILSRLGRMAETAPRTALGLLYAMTSASSAFINNTPVVLLMAPMLTRLGEQMKIPASKLLIPLSYAAIMGGMCTLIGTSTNLLVDGIAQERGLAPFTMFELAPGGLATLAAGALFVLLIGRYLLPARKALRDDIDESRGTLRFYHADIAITPDSPVVGQTLKDLDIENRTQAIVLDVIRNDQDEVKTDVGRFFTKLLRWREAQAEPAATSSLRDIALKPGYRVIFRATREQIVEIRGIFDAGEEAQDETRYDLADILIPQNHRLIGARIDQVMALQFYGLDPIAIHRRGHNISGDLNSTPLRAGDILIVEGTAYGIENFLKSEHLNRAFTDPAGMPAWKIAAPVICLAGVIAVSALGIMPIASASLAGAVALMLLRCIMLRDAYHAIQWQLLMLIYGMLGISIALESTGFAQVLVNGVMDMMGSASPIVVLSCFYLLTSILTEVMSNNAAAVILTPLAIGIAQTMGVDPRPFVVAVMLGASASFATPLGYQTNTYVYGIGNYRFSDFLRIGIPMNIIGWAVATFVIPLIWPL